MSRRSPRPLRSLRPIRRAARAAVVLAGLGLAFEASALETIPRVGVDFEHFAETFRITDDADTVAAIDDVATYAGVTLRSAYDPDRSFRLNADFHYGQQSRRARLDFEGRLRRGANAFELEQEGSYRFFAADGDYSLSGDYLQEYVRVTWERRVSDRARFRVRDAIDVLYHPEPDEYNLTSILHRPAADFRLGLGDLSEVRFGYELGRREVPDSTSLGYWRHVAEADLSLLFGWTSALDVSERLERRIYPGRSVRESSWESRADVSYEISPGMGTTYRVIHENEVIRYDDPDALDFDSVWARTGFQVELHRTLALDFSIMPLYAFLQSDGAPEEEYTEVALELGLDWRIGDRTWINLTNEIGRRDYEISATNDGDSTDDLTLEEILATDDLGLDTAWSDYVYNRLTLLLTSELTPVLAVNLFVNWQPENHQVNRHDTDTRIVSGGVEYRF